MTRTQVSGALLAALLLATAAGAQLVEDYRYKGKTVDTSGKPIGGVKILFFDAATSKRIEFESNDEGQFDRRLIPHGVYDVRFEKPGYIPLSERFDWDATSTDTITVEAEVRLESEEERALRQGMEAKRELGEKAAKLYAEAYAALGANDCPTAKGRTEELLALGAGSFEYAARFVLARCLRVLGEADLSIAEYRKVVDLKPDLYEAQFDLANVLAGKGMTDEALAAYGVAATLRPNDGGVQYEMGAILFNGGKLLEARPHLEKAVALEPTHALAHMALGYAILSSEDKDYQAAKRYLSRFLELDPANPNAATVKAIVDGIK